MTESKKGEASQPLKANAFVHECSTPAGTMKNKLGQIILRHKSDVCPLTETKTRGKAELMFCEVIGRIFGIDRGRAGGVPQFLSRWLLRFFDVIEGNVCPANVGLTGYSNI